MNSLQESLQDPFQDPLQEPLSTSIPPNPNNNYITTSFYFTYVLLLTTGTITLIEAISTNSPAIRHVMNLETCISLIAGYFYSQFIAKVTTVTNANTNANTNTNTNANTNTNTNTNSIINYKDINETRYNDWFITTPLMILVIMISLSYNNTGRLSIHIGTYITAILLNFGMLYSGYLGEKNTISKKTGCTVGFLFFIGLFALIYFQFVKGSSKLFNFVLFGIYLVIWGLYGIVYLLDEERKNVAYNVLDLISKCFVGLGLWMYFTKILI